MITLIEPKIKQVEGVFIIEDICLLDNKEGYEDSRLLRAEVCDKELVSLSLTDQKGNEYADDLEINRVSRIEEQLNDCIDTHLTNLRDSQGDIEHDSKKEARL